jgi:hypothetical protein
MLKGRVSVRRKQLMQRTKIISEVKPHHMGGDETYSAGIAVQPFTHGHGSRVKTIRTGYRCLLLIISVLL